jgi:hypothetical protein
LYREDVFKHAVKLVIGARMVLAHQTLFELKEPRGISAADLGNSVDLTLVKVQK